MYPYSNRKKGEDDEKRQVNSEELRIPRHEQPRHEPPRHEHHHGGELPLAPPAIIPRRSKPGIELFAIANCLYNATYIWLKNGREFWFYPVYAGRRSIAGFRWSGNSWAYYGFDVYAVEAFACGG